MGFFGVKNLRNIVRFGMKNANKIFRFGAKVAHTIEKGAHYIDKYGGTALDVADAATNGKVSDSKVGRSAKAVVSNARKVEKASRVAEGVVKVGERATRQRDTIEKSS